MCASMYVCMDGCVLCMYERAWKQNNEGKNKKSHEHTEGLFAISRLQLIFVYFLVLPIVVLAGSSDTNPTRTIA